MIGDRHAFLHNIPPCLSETVKLQFAVSAPYSSCLLVDTRCVPNTHSCPFSDTPLCSVGGMSARLRPIHTGHSACPCCPCWLHPMGSPSKIGDTWDVAITDFRRSVCSKCLPGSRRFECSWTVEYLLRRLRVHDDMIVRGDVYWAASEEWLNSRLLIDYRQTCTLVR